MVSTTNVILAALFFLNESMITIAFCERHRLFLDFEGYLADHIDAIHIIEQRFEWRVVSGEWTTC